MTVTIAALARELLAQHGARHELWLDVGGFTVELRSNSPALLLELAAYFTELCVSPAGRAHVRVTALEAEPPRFPLEYRDWPREPGKLGKKERYADTADGRAVLKTRTGMQFLLARDELLAVGPCAKNTNQVVNFVIMQYLGQRIDEGWALCHAAAVAWQGRGLGIAARAGAGKSTLALHLMSTGLSFASNDRLLIKKTGALTELAGVPKMPRVNPGTLLHNPDLAAILPPDRRAALARLDPAELWQLEEKYDVHVREVYGPGRCIYRAPLRALVVLNWARSAWSPARFDPVDIARRPDLLALIIKAPGVFHRARAGSDAAQLAPPNPDAHVRALAGVPVYEANGRVQFDEAVSFCRQLLERPGPTPSSCPPSQKPSSGHGPCPHDPQRTAAERRGKTAWPPTSSSMSPCRTRSPLATT